MPFAAYHRISLHKVRIAIDFIKEELKSDHPLAYHKLETDGLDLFVEEYGQLINVSRAGQLVLRNLLQAHLRRIDRDSAGYALRLYPFTRKRLGQQLIEEPKAIVIDPRISLRSPDACRHGNSYSSLLPNSYKAGEAIGALADDYGRPTLEIEEAIRP